MPVGGGEISECDLGSHLRYIRSLDLDKSTGFVQVFCDVILCIEIRQCGCTGRDGNEWKWHSL